MQCSCRAGITSDLLIIALDLMKTRVCVLNTDMRKNFVNVVVLTLIEKSNDVKVLRAITRMLEEWIKAKTPAMLSQTPTHREKSSLLTKLETTIEKRFPNDSDLLAQFLELVNYIYREESLRGSELTWKLESAFLSGLRCSQPSIRNKFMEVFDSSVKKRVEDRLLYIICSQNWQPMNNHFGIKQCIEVARFFQ